MRRETERERGRGREREREGERGRKRERKGEGEGGKMRETASERVVFLFDMNPFITLLRQKPETRLESFLIVGEKLLTKLLLCLRDCIMNLCTAGDTHTHTHTPPHTHTHTRVTEELCVSCDCESHFACVSCITAR